jgi:hypothetical protein
MAKRLGVLALEGMAAPTTLRRLEDLGVIGWQKRSLVTLVARLTAAAATRGGTRRSTLDIRRVGRRRLGGVGGVLVQAIVQGLNLFPQCADLDLEFVDPGLERENQGPGFGGQVVPDLNREWRPGTHSAGIARRRGTVHIGP